MRKYVVTVERVVWHEKREILDRRFFCFFPSALFFSWFVETILNSLDCNSYNCYVEKTHNG